MQTLDIHRPGMPDLQFALLVTALCTSRLTSLNIPTALRTRIFNRCWVLIHDSPPPGNPEERVLDLRPWTEVTLEAIVETIRSVLTEVGIRTLTWDHSPSPATLNTTPEARPLIDRLEQLYPHLCKGSDTVSGKAAVTDLRKVIRDLTDVMSALPPALTRYVLMQPEQNEELAHKVLKGADVLRESGLMYLRLARHYAAIAEGLEDEDP